MTNIHIQDGITVPSQAERLAVGTYDNKDGITTTSLTQILCGGKHGGKVHPHQTLPTHHVSRYDKAKALITLTTDTLHTLIILPLLIVAMVTKSIKEMFTSHHPNCFHESSAAVETEIVEDFTEFWPAEDVSSSEDRLKYEIVVDEYLLSCKEDFSRARREVTECMKNSYTHRLEVWQDVVQKHGIPIMNIFQTLDNMCTAITFGNKDLVLNLAKRFKRFKLPTENYSSHTMEGDMSLMHLIIMNHQHELAVEFLPLVSVEEQRCLVSRHSPDLVGEGVMQVAELPLNLAVARGDINMARLLIQHGAEMNEQDANGYNVFHAISFLGRSEPDKVEGMYDVLVECVPVWINKTTTFPFLQEMTAQNARQVALWCLLKTVDKHKFTPLKLSVSFGLKQLFQKIVNTENIYRFPDKIFSYVPGITYDLSEIDPYITFSFGADVSGSVLEFLVMLPNDDHLGCLHAVPINTLVDLKYKAYSHLFFVSVCFHVMCTLAASVAINKYTLPSLRCHPPVVYNYTENCSNLEPSDKLWLAELCLLPLALLSAFCSCRLFLAGYQILKRCNVICFTKMFYIYVHTMVMFSFTVFYIIHIVIMFLYHQREETFLALTIFCAWVQCITFFRGFESTAFFGYIFRVVIFGDMLKFLLVAFIFFMAYTLMTALIFVHDANFAEEHDWHIILMQYFRLSLGISDFKFLSDNSSHNPFGTVTYVTFIIVTNILILNLLIATMTDMYAQLHTNRDLLGRKCRAADCILMEQIVPCYVRSQLAVPTTHRLLRIKLPDGSYWEKQVYLMKG